MAKKLQEAQRSLLRAKEAAEQRLVEIEDERKELRSSIKSLDAALKAISRPTGRRARNDKPSVDPSIPVEEGEQIERDAYE